MSVEINQQIKKLSRIKIGSDFKTNLRMDLMERTAMNKPVKTDGFLNFNIFHIGFLKHAYAPIALGVFIFFGSGALAMMAAGDSLPGDILYGVKIAGEKAQITLTLRETSKIDKEMNFAENRVKELSRLTGEETKKIEIRNKEIRDDDDEDDETGPMEGDTLIRVEPEVIAKAVDDFHNELNKVNVRLDSLGKNNNVTETARAVEEKTGKFVDTLNKVAQKKDLSIEVKEKIARAFSILDEVNSRALGFVIKERLDIGAEEMNELVKRLDDKIAATEKQVASVDEIMKEEGVVGDSQGVLLSLEKKIELAKIILMEARESLVARDLEMTLQKVKESKELATNVNNEVNKVNNEVDMDTDVDGLKQITTDNTDDKINNDELIVEEIDEVISNK